MKRDELRQILKPLIKQCIKEVIFDDGVLSGIITEIVKGLSPATLVSESTTPPAKAQDDTINRAREHLKEENRHEHRQELEGQRQKLSESMSERFNGVNLFEGVAPMGKSPAPSSSPSAPSSPLEGIAPNDPGVDITKLGVFGK